MPTNEEQGLVLRGLDGGNPLGFLAAVGTLRILALAEADVGWRMRWCGFNGNWVPVLTVDRTVSQEELVELLFVALRRDSTPEFDFAKNLSVDCATFRKVARNAQGDASQRGRRFADFVAAFGCEIIQSRDGKSIQDTALRTMGGAGHQHFIGTMKELVVKTESDDLYKSLFESWDYTDDKLGLRWDPQEDRRYALRWSNPSGDVVKTMRGANRLAVEALPLLPTMPRDGRIETTGFTTRDRVTTFTWPIWRGVASFDAVRSLLSLAEFQRSEPDRRILQSRGVVEVYRSQRITVGKYRNFTVAQPT